MARGLVEATVLELESAAWATDALSFFELAIAPALESEGGAILGYFLTDDRENNFPMLPVREDVYVLAFFCGFRGSATLDPGCEARQALDETPGISSEPCVFRLEPAARSLLSGLTEPCPARVACQS